MRIYRRYPDHVAMPERFHGVTPQECAEVIAQHCTDTWLGDADQLHQFDLAVESAETANSLNEHYGLHLRALHIETFWKQIARDGLRYELRGGYQGDMAGLEAAIVQVIEPMRTWPATARFG